jgi:hypothetical protein
MLEALLIHAKRLFSWLHDDHQALPDDLDGACPVCDHPFGSLSHTCIGAVTRLAA